MFARSRACHSAGFKGSIDWPDTPPENQPLPISIPANQTRVARHLFCRFGCAVGLFQSLAWMANDRALVVGFQTRRAGECSSCNNACDNACPMRLRPRTVKRKMFTCTECTRCIEACDQVKAGSPNGGLLDWVQGDDALPVVTGRPAERRDPGQAKHTLRDLRPAAERVR